MSDSTSSQVRPHPTLLWELVAVVLIKLVILTVLWWMFIRDQRVEVPAEQPALPWMAEERPTPQGPTDDQ